MTGSSVLLDKALTLLDAIIADRGQRPVSAIADDLRLPQATAYRITGALAGRGLIVTCGRGRYLPGMAMISAASALPFRDVLGRVAAPFLNRAARRFGQVAHLGVFEDDMVTYLVKAGSGPAAQFTRQGMQLEAYCSAMGKVLLAHLPASALDIYLANGPFVQLTPNTNVDPDRLRLELTAAHAQGFAMDNEEIAENLRCVAVPIRDQAHAVCAAISISAPAAKLQGARLALAKSLLEEAANGVSERLFGSSGAHRPPHAPPAAPLSSSRVREP